jgi:hypothetical protein
MNSFGRNETKKLWKVLSPVLIIALVLGGIFVPNLKVKAATNVTAHFIIHANGYQGGNGEQDLPVGTFDDELVYDESTGRLDASLFLGKYPFYNDNGTSKWLQGITYSTSEIDWSDPQTMAPVLGNDGFAVSIESGNEVTLHLYYSFIDANMVLADETGARIGSSSFPISMVKTESNGVVYAFYDVTMPEPTKTGMVYTDGWTYSGPSVVTIYDEENDVVTNATLSGNHTYTFKVSNNSINELFNQNLGSYAFRMSAQDNRYISLPVHFDTDGHGEILDGSEDDSFESSFYIETTGADPNTNTPYWQVPINLPEVDAEDGYYFNRWTFEGPAQSGVVVSTDDGIMVKVYDTFATSSGAVNYTLTLKADYTHIGGAYSINLGQHGGSTQAPASSAYYINGIDYENDTDYVSAEAELPYFTSQEGWNLTGYKVSGIPSGINLVKEFGYDGPVNWANGDIINIESVNEPRIFRFSIAESSLEGLNLNLTFTAQYEEIVAPKLTIVFAGENPTFNIERTFTATSVVPQDGYYRYQVEMYSSSDDYIRYWSNVLNNDHLTVQSGTTNATFSLINVTGEILGGSTITLEANITEDTTVFWSSIYGKGLINGTGDYDLNYYEAYLAAGNWEVGGDGFKYHVDSGSTARIYGPTTSSVRFTKIP